MILPEIADYEALRRGFAWRIPQRFNIGVACCDVWAAREPDRPAILDATDGRLVTTTFGELSERSNRFAAALRARGVGVGDRLAILLPQSADVVVAHAAAYKLGAVALPLAALFGVDALVYRLADAGAKALVTDAAGLAKIAQIRDRLPDLELVACVDGAAGDALDFHRLLADADPAFTPRDTAADDPALMIYTSGTTGPPKGALHAHRVLPGHLPGVQFPHDFFPRPGDLMWTPADWAWAGGLLNILLPSLFFGVPVV
ncbi:MAG TPA: AMP-binding protein, partial [Beijerinckiaceae bacterium]